MRAGLVLAHQAAEPDDIGVQNRGELAPARSRLLRKLRRVNEHRAHRGGL
jgi:hypothetical protein